MADYLVSHEATITELTTLKHPVTGDDGTVPAKADVAEVGELSSGRRIVPSTQFPRGTVEFALGEKDGSGYLDLYVDETTAIVFPDGIEATLTIEASSGGKTRTGTVMLHNMRRAPSGLASVPGKQRVRYDWRGTLEEPSV